jgi:sugar fermentation stimulation protein A
METLARLRRSGARAALLFVVQRADCDRVRPADDLDPAYGAALREAVREGVEVLAVRAHVSPRGLRLDGALPVRL